LLVVAYAFTHLTTSAKCGKSRFEGDNIANGSQCRTVRSLVGLSFQAYEVVVPHAKSGKKVGVTRTGGGLMDKMTLAGDLFAALNLDVHGGGAGGPLDNDIFNSITGKYTMLSREAVN
jgi:hypothetical protein